MIRGENGQNLECFGTPDLFLRGPSRVDLEFSAERTLTQNLRSTFAIHSHTCSQLRHECSAILKLRQKATLDFLTWETPSPVPVMVGTQQHKEVDKDPCQSISLLGQSQVQMIAVP